MKTFLLFLILSIIPQTTPKAKYVHGYFECDSYIIVRFDPKGCDMRMFYKNAEGEVMGDFYQLNEHVKSLGKELIFACNGGMFMEDFRPLGLYVENGKRIMPLNTRSASTNFYIKPNGVFYILNNSLCGIYKTEDYRSCDIRYATQSGPMLVINGEINPKFDKSSTSYLRRNGVGIMDNGDVIFVLGKVGLSFYEFASIFKSFECKTALFLDGNLSDFYCPEIGYNGMWGYMSVMIGVVN